MKLTPLVYVTDMDNSIEFYTRLLPEATIVSSSPYWTELQVGEATLALHFAESVEHAGDGMGLGVDSSTRGRRDHFGRRDLRTAIWPLGHRDRSGWPGDPDQ